MSFGKHPGQLVQDETQLVLSWARFGIGQEPGMVLEFHQLDRRWEHLRVRSPERQKRLLATLAESGQQTPIVVVAVAHQPNRYLVIDGYKRIATL